ncbi:hypothetical protein [Sphingomonas sp. RB1R13]|uniref:hypothetical protein n=1 Tax=Sphingomonas sp. RB1R13 TaxID=3096159 RepID=UPI002FC8823E
MDETLHTADAAPIGTPVSVGRTPWHLWAVGLLSLAWNAIGGIDYTMTQTHNAAYLAAATPAQIAWFAGFPAWEVAAWALGVWGAIAGSLLLLARSRHAVAVFGVSLAGLAVSSAYQWFVNPPPGETQTGGMLALDFAIWGIAIALLLYAQRMKARGVLR